MKTTIKEIYVDFKMLEKCLELIEEAPTPLNVLDALSNSYLQSTKGMLIDSIEKKLMELLKSS